MTRATSVYLVDRVVPMLPEKLSNGVCSLRPEEDKLTFSAVFKMNEKGEVLDEWFGRTIIHSNRRFNYEEAQEIIETGEGDMKEEVLKLFEISQILKEKRFKNGSVNFERDEVKFHLEEDGTPTGVYFKVQKEANWLIEEFMLLANKKVAEYASRGGKYAKEVNPQELKGKKAGRENLCLPHSRFARSGENGILYPVYYQIRTYPESTAVGHDSPLR